AVLASLTAPPKPNTGPRLAGDFILDDVHAIDESCVSRYLAAAGDDNPIHRDGPTIRRFGLSAPIVPGMLIFGLIGRAADRSFAEAEVKAVSCRFLSPLAVPSAVSIRRRVVRSKPIPGGIETIARLSAGT